MSADTIGRLNHVAIAVHDLEAAIEYYRTTFGVEPVHRKAPLPIAAYRAYNKASEIAHGDLGAGDYRAAGIFDNAFHRGSHRGESQEKQKNDKSENSVHD